MRELRNHQLVLPWLLATSTPLFRPTPHRALRQLCKGRRTASRHGLSLSLDRFKSLFLARSSCRQSLNRFSPCALFAGAPPTERLRLRPVPPPQPRDFRHHRPRHLPPSGPHLHAPGAACPRFCPRPVLRLCFLKSWKEELTTMILSEAQ